MSKEVQAPNSSGSGKPRIKIPDHACDSHLHIYDARFPVAPGARMVENATVDDYRLLQERIGTTRAVIVQPKAHGVDNSCTLDAVAGLGIANARGIGVVAVDVSAAELRRLDAGGIRGLRYSVWNTSDTVTTMDMIEPMASRVAELGWHLQLHMSGDQMAGQAQMLDRLPCPIVIDHMGRLPLAQGLRHPAVEIMKRLVDKGSTWIKVSGFYLNTEVGAPTYSDAAAIATHLIDFAPERCVWGSDWPHFTEVHDKPDDALLIDLLGDAAPDEETLKAILVDNPGKLYGFDS